LPDAPGCRKPTPIADAAAAPGIDYRALLHDALIGVVRFTPRFASHFEETTVIDQVASVRVDAGLLFDDLIAETTGGWTSQSFSPKNGRHAVHRRDGTAAVPAARRNVLRSHCTIWE